MFQFFINEDKIENYHFSVLDDSRKIQYLIVGYWGKKGDKIDLMSPKGTLLLQAKQGNFSPFFQFDLIHQHKKIGSIQKHPGFFGLRDAFFTIQPENWVVRGNFENMNFTIYENEIEIAKTSKLLKQARNLYSLKLKRKDDLALVSLLSIVLDHYSREKQKVKEINQLFQKSYKFGFTNYRIDSNLFLEKYLLNNNDEKIVK